MADVTVHVDSSGNADNPHVQQGETIQWVLDDGVAGPFALDPPPNMFKGDDHPGCVTLDSDNPESDEYTVKHSATVGDHYYTIKPGACAKKGRKKPRTGPQRITVDTGNIVRAGSAR